MKTDEQAKQDLAKEVDDLNNKIERLEAFIKKYHPTDENLLIGQLKAMNDYRFYLIQRISNLGGLN